MIELNCKVCGKAFQARRKARQCCSRSCTASNAARSKKSLSLAERFERRVIRGEDCWAWMGSPDHNGYGFLVAEGRHLGAHRVSWMIHNGPVPNGMSVLHRCDNPICTNPAHLFLGTHLDNMLDRSAKGRCAPQPVRLTCRAGHPLTGKNLYLHPAKKRRCRMCSAAAAKATYWARKGITL